MLAEGTRTAGLPADRRIRAFDLARGLAVLFMILVHTLGHYGTDESWASPLGAALIFLGGPTAAPVFMFLMGTSLAFSRRSGPGEIARRGIWLLALAYTLNVLRGALPATLGLATGVVTDESIAPYSVAVLLTLVDIHQMAGLSLLVIAVLVAVAGRSGYLRVAAVSLAVIVALAAPALWGIRTGFLPLDLGLGLLWGSDWNVFFPLFPWLVYPLAGFVYGRTLVARPDRRRFVRRAGVVGIGFGLAGLAAIVAAGTPIGVEQYWRQPPAVLLAIVGLVIAWLSLADVVVARLRPNRGLDVLYGWSARVTSMYCVHWILIGWGVGLVGHRQLGPAALVIAMAIVVALSDRITAVVPFLRGPRSQPSGGELAPALVPVTPTGR